jgi:ABC-type Mn2+/Zn2+ transport system permease subunit
MVGLSALYGLGALAGGMTSSYHFDWQTGPAIVVSASALLLATLALSRVLRNQPR